jgi:hypothetical protein
VVGLAIAGALPVPPADAEPGWRLGIDVHGTDNAFAVRRPLGLAAGVRRGAAEATIVVDPMLLVLGWEMLDVSLGGWIAGDRVELLAGWRQTSGPLGRGRRYDESLLLGADAVAMSSGRLRIVFGAELSLSLWRHGGTIPDNVAPLALAELATRVDLLLHLRFEITGLP